jgi:hypothetical protein
MGRQSFPSTPSSAKIGNAQRPRVEQSERFIDGVAIRALGCGRQLGAPLPGSVNLGGKFGMIGHGSGG